MKVSMHIRRAARFILGHQIGSSAELSAAIICAFSAHRDRLAELEEDRTKGLDMIRDRLDADPATVVEAVDGLLKLYKMEMDDRLRLEHAQISVRVALSEALRLDDSHGPKPASMGFIVKSVADVVRQIVGSTSAKLASEPMVQVETTRLMERVSELEADKQAMIDDARRVENASKCPGDVDMLDHVEVQAGRLAELQQVVDELRPRSPSQRSAQLDRLIARVTDLESAILKAGKTVDLADRQTAKAKARVAELEAAAREVCDAHKGARCGHLGRLQFLLDQRKSSQ